MLSKKGPQKALNGTKFYDSYCNCSSIKLPKQIPLINELPKKIAVVKVFVKKSHKPKCFWNVLKDRSSEIGISTIPSVFLPRPQGSQQSLQLGTHWLWSITKKQRITKSPNLSEFIMVCTEGHLLLIWMANSTMMQTWSPPLACSNWWVLVWCFIPNNSPMYSN